MRRRPERGRRCPPSALPPLSPYRVRLRLDLGQQLAQQALVLLLEVQQLGRGEGGLRAGMGSRAAAPSRHPLRPPSSRSHLLRALLVAKLAGHRVGAGGARARGVDAARARERGREAAGRGRQAQGHEGRRVWGGARGARPRLGVNGAALAARPHSAARPAAMETQLTYTSTRKHLCLRFRERYCTADGLQARVRGGERGRTAARGGGRPARPPRHAGVIAVAGARCLWLPEGRRGA